MFRSAALVLSLALLLPACLATTEATQDRAPVAVSQPSDAYIELRPAEGGGAVGHILLTYADDVARNFRAGTLPDGMTVEPQGVRALWCGTRPDCGIREERLAVRLSPERVSESAREGLTFVLVADGAHSGWAPFTGNPQGLRQEQIFLPAHQMRHALRRGGVRF
jgi:hypothetical protein